MRSFTPIELAIGAALLGTVTAVAVPAFSRELHASRFVEPTEGLVRLSASALAFAEAATPEKAPFPASVPLTPTAPPRGTRAVDPPGTWDTALWAPLAFRPVIEGAPHAFAFAFDRGPTGNTFVAHAHGDLDGDGVFSTFEIRGQARQPESPKATVLPGMYVESELE